MQAAAMCLVYVGVTGSYVETSENSDDRKWLQCKLIDFINQGRMQDLKLGDAV